jgi:hypothetical protein
MGAKVIYLLEIKMSETIKPQEDNEESFFGVLTSRYVLLITKPVVMRYFCL